MSDEGYAKVLREDADRFVMTVAVVAEAEGRTPADIQRRVGFFLTNNAASELRKRGLNVVHSREGRVDSYQLHTSADLPSLNGASVAGPDAAEAPLSAGPSTDRSQAITSPPLNSGAGFVTAGESAPEQLTLEAS